MKISLSWVEEILGMKVPLSPQEISEKLFSLGFEVSSVETYPGIKNVVAAKILESKDVNYGFDAREDKFCDMLRQGIIDPTKVVRCALQNAASVSTLLLTSDALVADLPKDEKKSGGGGGGGGYDDMY